MIVEKRLEMVGRGSVLGKFLVKAAGLEWGKDKVRSIECRVATDEMIAFKIELVGSECDVESAVEELGDEALAEARDSEVHCDGAIDERYCDHCERDTEHVCRDSDHERDSSNDWRKCNACGWEYVGLTGTYQPPSEGSDRA